MRIKNAQEFFAVLVAHGGHPRLLGDEGVLEVVLEAETFSLTFKDGKLAVTPGPSSNPTARLQLSEHELVRLANADDHENLFTAMLRGALRVDGNIAFAQKVQAVLPLPDEWGTQP